MFKVGDIVISVNNYIYDCKIQLKKYNRYKIVCIYIYGKWISVINEQGIIRKYHYTQFRTVEKYRNFKLKKLGI